MFGQCRLFLEGVICLFATLTRAFLSDLFCHKFNMRPPVRKISTHIHVVVHCSNSSCESYGSAWGRIAPHISAVPTWSACGSPAPTTLIARTGPAGRRAGIPEVARLRRSDIQLHLPRLEHQRRHLVIVLGLDRLRDRHGPVRQAFLE
jgi:hypothetical protein